MILYNRARPTGSYRSSDNAQHVTDNNIDFKWTPQEPVLLTALKRNHSMKMSKYYQKLDEGKKASKPRFPKELKGVLSPMQNPVVNVFDSPISVDLPRKDKASVKKQIRKQEKKLVVMTLLGIGLMIWSFTKPKSEV